jgi:hypothetical protein
MAIAVLSDLNLYDLDKEIQNAYIIAPSYILIEKHVNEVREKLNMEEERLVHLQMNLYATNEILKLSVLTKLAYIRFENNIKKKMHELKSYIKNSPTHVCQDCKKKHGWCSDVCSTSAFYWVNKNMAF